MHPARLVRTCVGCRQRANASELLRVVAVDTGGRAQPGGSVEIVPDPRRRKPGRGAHVHPTPACLALAERRRAFGRALRVTGVCDLGPLREAIQGGDLRPDGSTTGSDVRGTALRIDAEQGRTTDMSTR